MANPLIRRIPLTLAGIGLWATAAWISNPTPKELSAWGANLSRPTTMPFLWRGIGEASRSGNAAEALAKARLLMTAIPGWTDGYLVFSYRFALDGGELVRDPRARLRAALDRLQIALALLEEGRQNCPGRAAEILGSMAFLIDMMGRNHPGLGDLLQEQSGRSPNAMADELLAEAERLEAATGGQSARLQRMLLVPRLCASLLRGGSPDQAVQLLDSAIARCRRLTDEEFRDEWQSLLEELRRCILDDPAAQPATLLADPRFELLAPFLK